MGQSLWESPMRFTVLARLMGVSDMAPACQLCWGKGLEKGQQPLLSLMPETSVPPFIPLVPFKLLPQCWSSREWVWAGKSVRGLRGTAWGSSSFFHKLNPHWFLQPEAMGTYLPGQGFLIWIWDSSLLRHPSQIFIHHMWVRDHQPIPHLCPSYQSGWMWFL